MSDVRIAGRILARELKAEEIRDVSGAAGGGEFVMTNTNPTYCIGSREDGDFYECDCGAE